MRKIVHVTCAGVVATAGTDAATAPAATSAVASAAQSAVAVLETVEAAKDVGHWLVLHLAAAGSLAPGQDSSSGAQPDMGDPLDLLERCVFLMNEFREESVHDQFRCFVIVDYRSARSLPRWLCEGRAVCRGTRLSNTTCLTHVFFKSGE